MFFKFTSRPWCSGCTRGLALICTAPTLVQEFTLYSPRNNPSISSPLNLRRNGLRKTYLGPMVPLRCHEAPGCPSTNDTGSYSDRRQNDDCHRRWSWSPSFMLFLHRWQFRRRRRRPLLILRVHCMANGRYQLAGPNHQYCPALSSVSPCTAISHSSMWAHLEHLATCRQFVITWLPCMTVVLSHYPKQKLCQYWLFFYNFQGDRSFCWSFIECLDQILSLENIQREIQLSASLF